MKTVEHRSAGGLVVHGDRILLISTQSGRRWQLPKGHIEEGETSEQAAVREVREETGVTSRVVASLPGVEYWFVERGAHRVHKRVDYFLLAYISGDTADFDPREVSGAEWFAWDEGIAKLSFENERRVVEQARVTAADSGDAFPEQVRSARRAEDGTDEESDGGNVP
jgi:8-oxo-dGTP pyrophosphatase MutT (NUDIX family)